MNPTNKYLNFKKMNPIIQNEPNSFKYYQMSLKQNGVGTTASVQHVAKQQGSETILKSNQPTEHFIGCSDCALKKHNLDKDTQIERIKKINHSIGWSHYDHWIIDQIKTNSKNVILAVQNGQISGYAVYRPEQNGGTYVSYVGVDATKQRTGTGKQLMNRIFHKVQKHKGKTLFLEFRGKIHNASDSENIKLINFYSSFPYRYNIKKNDLGYYSNGDTRYSIKYALPPLPEISIPSNLSEKSGPSDEKKEGPYR